MKTVNIVKLVIMSDYQDFQGSKKDRSFLATAESLRFET